MATGPSTTQSPYIVGNEPNVRFTSIISAGESLGTRPDGVANRMVGIPDGLGAFDNGNGTFTLLMNHEITPLDGIVREHGSRGAFVSEIVINKSTLQVVSAQDLIKDVFQFNALTGGFTGDVTTAFNRFCSADLADVSAFFDAATGLGTRDRIFLTGEEAGTEGRLFAAVASGAEKGGAYELAALGKFSWENALASPNSGARTVVISTDDSTPGQVYVYVGDKQATGNTVQRAGLTNGQTFGIKVEGVRTEDNTTTLANDRARFTLEALGDVSRSTGAQLEIASDTRGVTEFFRPEDGHWDTQNPNRFYFVTTANIDSNSRLYALDFVDVKNPALGGTINMLLRGDEGHRMADNMTVTADGRVLFQEDPGGNARLAKIWEYNPRTDTLVQLGEHDPARFIAPTPPFSIDEESSGIIDATLLLGDADTQTYLLDVQAHYGFGAVGSADRQEIVQGGQVLAMFIDRPRDGGAGNDVVNGGSTNDRLNGGAGDDLIQGGSGADLLGGGTGRDSIDGGAGDDFVGGEADDDRISGGAGVDVLFGDAGNDLIGGGLGADRLFGQDGDDFMGGEADNDFLDGGAGTDVLFGDAGDDGILGGAGNDRLFGGDGADTLIGQAGDDFIDGGAGLDTAVFGGARAGYTITTAGGVTTVTGRDGTDRLIAVERLQFDDQAVTLSSAPGAGADEMAPLPTAAMEAPLPPLEFVI